MKKFLISLICLTSISQAMPFEQERPNYYECEMEDISTTIIENGHRWILLHGGCLTLRGQDLLIKQGGHIVIEPGFPSANIILENDHKIFDENLKITLTAQSPQEDWDRWIRFCKSQWVNIEINDLNSNYDLSR